MIAMVVAARALRRPVRVGDALAMAAMAMLLFDPLAALTAGFWLSFAGVAWLAWCLPDAGKRIVGDFLRSEEHTSELQSLMRISYAVFCLKKKKPYQHCQPHT